jgi:cell division protein FtsQ
MYTPENPEPIVEVAKRSSSFWSLLQKLILIILVGFIAWRGWLILRDPQRFPIHGIQVEADYQHINPQTLQQTIASQINGSFFSLNVTQLKKRVLELPWVSEVTVSRSWPDKIIIKITEHNPVARWNDNELLSSDAKIFAPDPATIPNNLPVFYGPEDQAAEALQTYQQINSILVNLKLSIVQVNLDVNKNWQVVLNNGIKLTLGNIDILQRINLFVSSYPNVVGNFGNEVESVDLRYDSGMAVKWKATPNKPILDPNNP